MLNNLKRKIKTRLLDLKYTSALHNAASICNKETFSSIKNSNFRKEIAICGAGPTLKNYIPMSGVKHVALNRALLNEKIKYDYFIADDWDGIDFFQDVLKEYDCIKFFGHQIGSYERQIPESFLIKCGAKRYYTDSYYVEGGYNSRFVCDIDKMAIGNMANIALSAMQIVLFTNPSKVYLVGCDASSGHFVQPKSLNNERIKNHEKDLKMAVYGDKVIDQWRELKRFAQAFYPDTEIISINPVGLKGIFKDVFTEH